MRTEKAGTKAVAGLKMLAKEISRRLRTNFDGNIHYAAHIEQKWQTRIPAALFNITEGNNGQIQNLRKLFLGKSHLFSASLNSNGNFS